MPAEQLTKFVGFHAYIAVSRLLTIGLLLCFVSFLSVSAQTAFEPAGSDRVQAEMNNGAYIKALEFASDEVAKAKRSKGPLLISRALTVRASAEIYLEKYNDAAKTLAEALQILPDGKTTLYQKALIYSHYAWLFRIRRKFSESLNYSKKAIASTPENRNVLAAHYLNTGKIMFTSGYDASAIVWLERAEKLLELEKVSSMMIDTYRFLSLAWWSKLNYHIALKYAEKCALASENTQFKYKHRQALLDLETILSESGQENRAIAILTKGLELSLKEKNSYQACKFLAALLLHHLDVGDVTQASIYLNKLEELNAGNLFTFEIYLGKAIIAAFKNEKPNAEKFFAVSESQPNSEEFPLLYWKLSIAERNQDWDQFVKINQDLVSLTKKENFRSGLPKLYLNFAKAYIHLNKRQTSEEYLHMSLALVEEIRKSENNNLSLSLSETYHDVYRLLVQLKLEDPKESFELADFLKARQLKDRIDGAATKYQSIISPAARKQLEELSLKYFDDQSFAAEIEREEKLVASNVPEFNLSKLDATEMDKISGFDEAAVVSYFFTIDNKLLAFVKEKGRPVRTVYLNISEDEIDTLAKTTEQKIKNFVFFKRNGKEVYDKLLRPLSLAARHLIIIPSKSLWRIPFQALSSDGEKYLIEDTTISYVPSASILLEELRNPKPKRQTLQAFANASYANGILNYVNAEAIRVAQIYGTKPILNATVADFVQNSDHADILHFSMHAQVDIDQPLESFLAFRDIGKDNGRLTVENILDLKLRKGSLVFLASCDTNNVLSGEGLVSLAWGMMGAGATTVISAQWEANDKSTEMFAEQFYREYLKGVSVSKAMQAASIVMIRNKSSETHEPYYWAAFTLLGDFR